MTQKTIEKNTTLSSAFGDYISKHPDILESVPQNAQIIMGDESDRGFTQRNARAFKRANGKLYQAVKGRHGWKIKKV